MCEMQNLYMIWAINQLLVLLITDACVKCNSCQRCELDFWQRNWRRKKQRYSKNILPNRFLVNGEGHVCLKTDKHFFFALLGGRSDHHHTTEGTI